MGLVVDATGQVSECDLTSARGRFPCLHIMTLDFDVCPGKEQGSLSHHGQHGAIRLAEFDKNAPKDFICIMFTVLIPY